MEIDQDQSKKYEEMLQDLLLDKCLRVDSGGGKG